MDKTCNPAKLALEQLQPQQWRKWLDFLKTYGIPVLTDQVRAPC